MKKFYVALNVLAFLFFAITGCSTISSALHKPSPVEPESDSTLSGVIQGPLQFNYPVRESLDVSITFENQRAYDAVQLGLSLLDQRKDMGNVPGIEDPEFFPDFFALVNLDITDGLLMISEVEAANFARETYLQFQKTIVPPGYLRNMRKHRIVQEILSAHPVVQNRIR